MELKNVTVQDEHETFTDTANNDAGVKSESITEAINITATFAPKKKKKKKKKIEDEDDNEPYDLSIPLKNRIGQAIERFRRTRKFNEFDSKIFSAYLYFGGIFENEISDHVSSDDSMVPEGMEVDFTYIVKAFLSSHMLNESGYVGKEYFFEGPRIVESFLNYLIRKDVFPEYIEDMQQALQITQTAKVELYNCKMILLLAPGKLNKACSLYYGGELYGRFNDPWPNEDSLVDLLGISPREAEQIIMKTFGNGAVNDLTRVDEASRFEMIVKIIDLDTFKDEEEYIKNITVCEHLAPDAEPFTISVASDIAPYPMIGMIIKADFHQLSNGFWYWDNIVFVHPTYYLEYESSENSDED